MSVNIADLTAWQGYVQKYGPQIMSRGLLEFETAKHVAHMPGVKGIMTETKMQKNGNLLRGYDGVFQGYDSQKLIPVHYTTDEFKTEVNVRPTDIMYKSYLGFLTTNGFKAHEWPFMRYFFDEHMKGVAEEMEVAIWNAEKDPAALANAPVLQKMDGFAHRIEDAITAGNTPVVTGAITAANIVGQLQTMYDRLGRAYKSGVAHCFLSVDHEQDYHIAKGQTLQYITDQWMSKNFNTARMELKFVPGLDKNKLLVTIPQNLVYNYDGIDDINNWHLKQEHYTIEASAIARAGTTIIWQENPELVVNNQWA